MSDAHASQPPQLPDSQPWVLQQTHAVVLQLDQALVASHATRSHAVDQVEQLTVQLRNTLIALLRQSSPDQAAYWQPLLDRVNLTLSLIVGVEYPAEGDQQTALAQARATLVGIEEALLPRRREQLFRPSANTVAKFSIVAGLVTVGLLFTLWGVFIRSPYYTGATVAVEQPVPFSHKQHVGLLGLDCRMCHASVEQSAAAGMPPTQTCMTCHSQIWADAPALAPVRESFRTGIPISWNRVYEVPGYVYFNHSIHVKKGVGCVSCHGRVDTMPLTVKAVPMTMQWCLACHRAPEHYLRPPAEVFNTGWVAPDQITLGRKLVDDYHIVAGQRLTNCSICHR